VDLLHREFSSITPELELIWDATEPQEGEFAFAAAERVVAHAEERGMLVRGHSLAWHSQQPRWAQVRDGPPLRAAMINHIRAVAGHFAGRIHSWNVASEAFNANGTRRASNLQRTGDDWIEAAFRAARDADPQARLCYDDYHIEGHNPKSDAVYAMVRDLRDRGVPIDCVGFQGHFDRASPFPADLRANLERFAALGVEVQITELDSPGTSDQPEVYAGTVRACLAVPRCTGITVSSIRDSDSWRAGDLPALFDRNGEPKPAYAATLAALNGEADPRESTSDKESDQPNGRSADTAG
jgi:endo-1,4-beta-xylanase